MMLVSKFLRQPTRVNVVSSITGVRWNSSAVPESHQDSQEVYDDEEFRVLNLTKTQSTTRIKRRIKKPDALPPRSKQMAVDQDWGSVWPGPRSFHPASVPLPVRQGYTPKGMAAPSKYANAELAKIPNFLHLTPPVIKRQCEALKKFCTPWPEDLKTEDEMEKHFPIETFTSDYCHGLPTIRNPLSRIVSIRLKLSLLPLDKHAKDKFLRLVGDRYDPQTDVLTIVTDRCPLRQQNLDYANYLLTAVFHESWVTEPWEATKCEADMEEYIFNNNRPKQTTDAILNWGKKEDEPKAIIPSDYAKSMENLFNEGENNYALDKLKEATVKMLGLKQLDASQ